MSITKDMKRIVANRCVNKEFNELTKNITNKVAGNQQHGSFEVQIAELETKRQVLENYINQIRSQQ
jgi:hypothetical protein